MAEDITKTDEFTRAWDIHGMWYEGIPVSQEDQKFYDEYLTELLNIAEMESLDNTPDQQRTVSLSTNIWLMYAIRYTTGASKGPPVPVSTQ